MTLQDIHQNEKIHSHQPHLLSYLWYLLVFCHRNHFNILYISNKVIDGIIGGLEKESEINIDTTEMIYLCDKTLALLFKSIEHLIWLFILTIPLSQWRTTMKPHLIYIRKYETYLQQSILTYNWNTIILQLAIYLYQKKCAILIMNGSIL